MNLERDFDVKMYQWADHIGGPEHKWPLTDFAFLEMAKQKRPFFTKMRNGLTALAQISKIRIQVTFEMREPVLE